MKIVNKRAIKTLIALLFVTLIYSCSKSSKNGGNSDPASATATELPTGFFRLSSTSAFPESGEAMVMAVKGDLLQKLSLSGDVYTIEQSGYAELSYGGIKAAIGCPVSTSGSTKWQFRLDSAGKAIDGQQLVSTCTSEVDGAAEPSDVALVPLEESFEIVSEVIRGSFSLRLTVLR